MIRSITRAAAAAIAILLMLPFARASEVTFTVVIDPVAAKEPVSGRLIVFLTRADDRRLRGRDPADGPFFESPSPMFAVDVQNAQPGSRITVANDALSFPGPASLLPTGFYRAQAVLVRDRQSSSWRRTPGNLFSTVSEFTIQNIGTADEPERSPEPINHIITLSRVTRPRDLPPMPPGRTVEIFSIRSALLSDFHGRDITLRAGVALPMGYDANPDRRFPAIYEIPGFGGDEMMAFGSARAMGMQAPITPAGILARNAFFIVPSPDSPNGHTLFADSANNGPWARALVEELIPALERHYRLEPAPMARVLRGHSSGGWSVIWLAINHPDTFGAAFSTAPDPVDFAHFQLTNIYNATSIYFDVTGDTPSFRDEAGVVRMTVRQENLMEEILGPENTSGQQWDSWQAVFSPRLPSGRIAPLYDARTGTIDKAVAASWRAFDIAERLRRNPGVVGPIFKQRIRIVCGEEDNYFLNHAVASLKQQLDDLAFLHFPEGQHGYIRLVPGADHSNVFQTDEVQAMQQHIIDHLQRHNLIPTVTPPPASPNQGAAR